MSDQEKSNVINITSPSGATPTPEQVIEQAAIQGIEIHANTIFLDQRDVQIIMAHSSISKTVEKKLPINEQEYIKEIKRQFYALFDSDAGKVAYQLFQLEIDNTNMPYGDVFAEMEQVTWEEALEMWKAGK